MAARLQPSAPSGEPGSRPGEEPDPALWQELGWTPDSGQLAALLALQDQLRLWNGRVNLTRLVEGDDFWIAQVFDSLWPWVPLLTAPGGVSDGLEVIDVGTGGGFPGLALAIALPTARLTLVDSVGRKLEAVQAMATSLGLEGRLELRCERVERTGRSPDCRGRFDRAMARAVAGAPVVAEYLMPLLRPDGQALLYRGQWGPADQQALEAAARMLKARVEPAQRRDLPGGRGVRHGLWLRPAGPCPAAYPRPVGVPQKQPIAGQG
ncbi:MAG: 16S rRNA methyltransferase [Cyanobium sp. CACIAM 14]|nr:MAG: 16S rRNA methyltransferase [Cyanobium sp. CACIAM 14]